MATLLTRTHLHVTFYEKACNVDSTNGNIHPRRMPAQNAYESGSDSSVSLDSTSQEQQLTSPLGRHVTISQRKLANRPSYRTLLLVSCCDDSSLKSFKWVNAVVFKLCSAQRQLSVVKNTLIYDRIGT